MIFIFSSSISSFCREKDLVGLCPDFRKLMWELKFLRLCYASELKGDMTMGMLITIL